LNRMNSYVDDIVLHQVEQFNRELEVTANFYKDLLKLLCAERVKRDFEAAYDQPVQIRTIHPRSKQLRAAVGQVLHQAGKASNWLVHRVLRGVYSQSRATADQPIIVEGEYTIFSDEADKANITQTKKEEN
jgi:hypothetical protein